MWRRLYGVGAGAGVGVGAGAGAGAKAMTRVLGVDKGSAEAPGGPKAPWVVSAVAVAAAVAVALVAAVAVPGAGAGAAGMQPMAMLLVVVGWVAPVGQGMAPGPGKAQGDTPDPRVAPWVHPTPCHRRWWRAGGL